RVGAEVLVDSGDREPRHLDRTDRRYFAWRAGWLCRRLLRLWPELPVGHRRRVLRVPVQPAVEAAADVQLLVRRLDQRELLSRACLHGLARAEGDAGRALRLASASPARIRGGHRRD